MTMRFRDTDTYNLKAALIRENIAWAKAYNRKARMVLSKRRLEAIENEPKYKRPQA